MHSQEKKKGDREAEKGTVPNLVRSTTVEAVHRGQEVEQSHSQNQDLLFLTKQGTPISSSELDDLLV